MGVLAEVLVFDRALRTKVVALCGINMSLRQPLIASLSSAGGMPSVASLLLHMNDSVRRRFAVP